MRLDFGGVTRHPESGQLGTRARIILPLENGWSGVYEFDTHGLSRSDVVRKIDGLKSYHAKKAARLTGFKDVLGSQFSIGGRKWAIVDCTLWEAGGEVELYLDVREGDLRVEGFPIIRRFATIEDVIDNASIIALVQKAVSDQVASQAAHAEFVSRTLALLGGGG